MSNHPPFFWSESNKLKLRPGVIVSIHFDDIVDGTVIENEDEVDRVRLIATDGGEYSVMYDRLDPRSMIEPERVIDRLEELELENATLRNELEELRLKAKLKIASLEDALIVEQRRFRLPAYGDRIQFSEHEIGTVVSVKHVRYEVVFDDGWRNDDIGAGDLDEEHVFLVGHTEDVPNVPQKARVRDWC